MKNKDLVKALLKLKNINEVENTVLNFFPGYAEDASFKTVKAIIENNDFNLLTIRTKILNQNSIYTEIVIKTANELKVKKLAAIHFNSLFKANWIDAVLMDNISSLIGVPHLPTLTLYSLDSYIKGLKTIPGLKLV